MEEEAGKQQTGRSKVFWWIFFIIVIGIYMVVDGVPKLTAYQNMTPEQKAFYQSLETRKFTEDEMRTSVDISVEFGKIYPLDELSGLELAELLLTQGFWIQGGGIDGKFTASEDGTYSGFLRRSIYPGLKGQFWRGEVFVGLWRRADGETGHRYEIIFITKFS